ncbi:unnamed protein product [Danaus chrysippus]|uniref:(African queen) hypothetical protein n=1 Tax=Danaus chrysippus TaxID=151541 RepID=A0A8J2QWC8_9NEOP|nr:unnamed protein product [Danaus chrysippus]
MESDPKNASQDKNFNYLIHYEKNNIPNNSNLRYCGRNNFIRNYFNETNNIHYEELCLNETQHGIENDNSFEDFDIILDLDNYEFITKIKETESYPNPAHNWSPLDDHNYCLKPLPEKRDTIKLKDFYNLKTFNGPIHNDIDDALKKRKENSDSSSEKNMSTLQSKEPEIYIISDESENELAISISSDDNDSDCEIINDFTPEYGPKNYKMTHEKIVKNVDIPKKYGLSNLNVTNQHDIPNETEYINMFETHIPYPMYCMENKSIYKNVCNIEYQDIGFDMRLCKNDDLKENCEY